MRAIELKKYIVPAKIESNITLIGDLHYTPSMEDGFLSTVSSEVRKDKATICFVGDLLYEASVVAKEEDRERIKNFVKELSEENHVKIILGNHDIMSREASVWVEDLRSLEFFKELERMENVTFLDNTINSELNTRNTFCGINPGFSFYENADTKEALLKKLRELRYIREYRHNAMLDYYEQNKILLMHSPYSTCDEEINEELRDYDLILTGHVDNRSISNLIDNKTSNKGFITSYNDLLRNNSRGYKVLSDTSHLIITGGLTKIAGDSKLKTFLNGMCPVSIDRIKLSPYTKELILRKERKI